MRLIINIDSNTYKMIKDENMSGNPWEISCAIANGTPIPDNATVCDIEQIRDEIAKLRDSEQHGNMVRLYGWDSMKKKVLQIIDKYTKGE